MTERAKFTKEGLTINFEDADTTTATVKTTQDTESTKHNFAGLDLGKETLFTVPEENNEIALAALAQEVKGILNRYPANTDPTAYLAYGDSVALDLGLRYTSFGAADVVVLLNDRKGLEVILDGLSDESSVVKLTIMEPRLRKKFHHMQKIALNRLTNGMFNFILHGDF